MYEPKAYIDKLAKTVHVPHGELESLLRAGTCSFTHSIIDRTSYERKGCSTTGSLRQEKSVICVTERQNPMHWLLAPTHSSWEALEKK